ncbi:alkanesulfonate monooxygenase SsuD/methylene tetrahydromethanopterin reductase-like flavin-dependent oxidoreductase (luciferase family) [Nocardia transvalensis]|uniref:Alkanesulfonate monooxygenase SsuD/methylene tetrahydromethanopterin reductase-like flavin-dependent oxidoreductase (Luciferase family) n=1 Tax=Nocardia transvalensis TaxID=37333 RepID=A0A7W9PFX1_9NOCA|nr:LLM class flavin-dependent oxidoreductase [Nocardia transvalensis]MBB5915429.1 alkanesulfonate monooxygenase SsuD/methylene tetrahydromethanopterin reductase-like flavin-dependent oxidoreductase (luciferase family) [Nocardia transvalensis]
MAEFFLFLPQVRLPVADIVERAQAAEAVGFDGVAFIDHLQAPGAERQPLWEAMTVATWVAARTNRLRIGHLVLCDAFRNPAVLAKQAVTLHEASGGRFELGLGSGSVPRELVRFGVTEERAAARRERLGHTLRALTRYWGADGTDDEVLPPRPTTPIPLVIGGVGPRTLDLVRDYATWWNLPATEIGRLPELAPSTGRARVSIQQMIGFIGSGDAADEVRERSARRFGYLGDGLHCGTAPELIDHFTALTRLGVERFYVWFSDFAPPPTLAEFGESVIGAMAPGE